MSLPVAGGYTDAPRSTSRAPVPIGAPRGPHDLAPHDLAPHDLAPRRPADWPVTAAGPAPAAPAVAAMPAAVAAEPDEVCDPSESQSRAALHAACLTLTAMAAAIGVPRATLAAYRLGTRRPPAAVRARLAAYLTARAEALRAHAAALAGEGDPPARHGAADA